jgi:hypothetical protein
VQAEGMRFRIQKTPFPSACASGFEAQALLSVGVR